MSTSTVTNAEILAWTEAKEIQEIAPSLGLGKAAVEAEQLDRQQTVINAIAERAVEIRTHIQSDINALDQSISELKTERNAANEVLKSARQFADTPPPPALSTYASGQPFDPFSIVTRGAETFHGNDIYAKIRSLIGDTLVHAGVISKDLTEAQINSKSGMVIKHLVRFTRVRPDNSRLQWTHKTIEAFEQAGITFTPGKGVSFNYPEQIVKELPFVPCDGSGMFGPRRTELLLAFAKTHTSTVTVQNTNSR